MIIAIPKPNSVCSFDIFGKRVFGFVGIKLVGVFFLAIVLIVAMFNF